MNVSLTKRKSLSIRHKLFFALLVMNILTLLVGFFSWNTFRGSGATIRHITEDMIPMMKSVSEVNVLGSRIRSQAPRLLSAQSVEELESMSSDLSRMLDEMERIIDEIPLGEGAIHHGDHGHHEQKFFDIVKNVSLFRAQMEQRLTALKKEIAEKISLSNQQEINADKLSAVFSNFMMATPPILDNAQYNLLLGLEGSQADNRRLLSDAEAMTLAFQIQAEGNQLAGILETVQALQDAARLPPQQERFDAISARLHDHLQNIQDENQEYVVIKESIDEIAQLASASDGIFKTQYALLEQNILLSKDLERLESISHSMGDAVNLLASFVEEDVDIKRQETDDALNAGMLTVIVISVTGILFTILISWLYISRRLVGRLEKLRSVMLALANKDFSQTIEGRFEGDETGQMAAALFTFREKLIENELLTRDLRYAIEESNRARHEADKASQSKSEFLANMSHELRTPLNSIIGLSRILVDDMPGGENHEMANTVHKSAVSLLDIVNDILDLSKIEAGQMVLEHIGFDFKETMAGIIETLAPIASGKGVWLHYKYEKENLPYIVGDPARLSRILTNLVGNAIKYTLDGSVQVLIDYEGTAPGRIEITCRIADTGIGIAQEKQEIIFQKFSQADSSTTRKFGGTGLGLAITKELVEMMDGTIGVSSTVGEGSTFWFTVPFETTATLKENARDHVAFLAAGPQEATRINAADAKILIAEDHQLNQVFIKKLLDRLGFKGYMVVESGKQVIEVCKAHRYDMILMDCHMPEMSGYQATESIRASENGTRVPIIALTADAMVGTSEKCFAAGMDDYISKPIDSKTFISVLERWFIFDQSVINPAAAPPVDERIVDFSSLNEYADTDDERRDFCRIFVTKTAQSIEGLRANCTDGPNETWAEIAHQIKGNAGMIGALRLAELCAQAQNMQIATQRSREDKLHSIENAYEAVKVIFDKEVFK